MAVPYTDAEKTQIRELADAGSTWEEIGLKLERSATAVEYAARRMRKRGEWGSNPDSVREPPDGPGRPRNRKPSTPVSVRFAPDLADAVRTVSVSAGFGRRVGRVFTEAARRAIARANGQRVRGSPFGLDPGRVIKLINGDRSHTVSACIDECIYMDLIKRNPDAPPTAVLHDAIVRLLQDLNYEIIES